MSRIGKLPVQFPANVKVTTAAATVTVEGPHGSLSQTFDPKMGVVVDEQKREVRVERPSDQKQHRALHGLTRALIQNMVRGVTEPYEKRLLIHGVGYGAGLKGKQLSLTVGFSHDVKLDVPDNVTVTVRAPQDLSVGGCDKQAVGDFAARIRKVRPPEPYNGKGIRYGKTKDQREEKVRRKSGKAFGSGDK